MRRSLVKPRKSPHCLIVMTASKPRSGVPSSDPTSWLVTGAFSFTT